MVQNSFAAGSRRTAAGSSRIVKRKYAGLGNGDLVTLDPATGEVASRTKLGGEGEVWLMHGEGEQRLFAGLQNGELVSVDLMSGEVASRKKIGDSMIRCGLLQCE